VRGGAEGIRVQHASFIIGLALPVDGGFTAQ
jgi:hypothetical protein